MTEQIKKTLAPSNLIKVGTPAGVIVTSIYVLLKVIMQDYAPTDSDIMYMATAIFAIGQGAYSYAITKGWL